MATSVITNYLGTNNSKIARQYFEDNNVYIFIGKSSEWDVETQPEDIEDTVEDLYTVYDNIVAMKRVLAPSIRNVVRRIDWSGGTVYDYYRQDLDMINGTNDQGENYNFYVFTNENNVYKCLSNNNGAPSTTQPTGELTTSFKTDDGYVWKFMYKIKTEDIDYITAAWIPIYTLSSNDGTTQWLVQQTAVSGSIEHIQVESGGTGYDQFNPPTVTVSGDGTGCVASAVVNEDGQLESINVDDPGQGYTQATVNITDPIGINALATAIISPRNGHGSDAINELGGGHIYVSVELDGDESGVFPLDSYRQTGIIVNPKSYDTGSILTVNNAKYFSVGETITGNLTSATGTIRFIDFFNEVVHVDNVTGTFSQGEDVSNGTYTTTLEFVQSNENMILFQPTVNTSSIVPNTGEIIYTSNRLKVTRDPEQLERIEFIVNF